MKISTLNVLFMRTLMSPAYVMPKSWRPKYAKIVITLFWRLRGSKSAALLGDYARVKMMAANAGAELSWSTK